MPVVVDLSKEFDLKDFLKELEVSKDIEVINGEPFSSSIFNTVLSVISRRVDRESIKLKFSTQKLMISIMGAFKLRRICGVDMTIHTDKIDDVFMDNFRILFKWNNNFENIRIIVSDKNLISIAEEEFKKYKQKVVISYEE
jgi:hypothetical protein